MLSFKNVMKKKSVIIYIFLIALLFFYDKDLFLNNNLSKLAWLVIIISFIAYSINKNILS